MLKCIKIITIIASKTSNGNRSVVVLPTQMTVLRPLTLVKRSFKGSKQRSKGRKTQFLLGNLLLFKGLQRLSVKAQRLRVRALTIFMV